MGLRWPVERYEEAAMAKEKNSELMIVSAEVVRSKIYVIRGQRVMLDADLAQIYGYTTKTLNQQVKRNIEKFEGDEFMFQLTEDEVSFVKSQFVTSPDSTFFSGQEGGTRKRPYAFTEQGIYMLMTVLKGDLAVRQSRALVLLFKRMKDYILDTQGAIGQTELAKLALQTSENTQAIRRLEAAAATKDELRSFMTNFYDEHLGKELLLMDGRIVEAAVAYETIYSRAKKTIHIIDNYIGIKTLLPLKGIGKKVAVTIFSDNIGTTLRKSEREEFQKEYPQVRLSFQKTCGKIHDRFIILDYGTRTEQVFHCGCSSKDAGKRVAVIAKMTDVRLFSLLMQDLMGNPKLVLK